MSKANLSNDIDIPLDQYFTDLSGENPNGVYDMVIQSVEKPLLLYIMNLTEGNQSRAADILGLNRNTLRKKLKQHKIET